MLTTRQANKTSRHGVDFARPLDRLTSISAERTFERGHKFTLSGCSSPEKGQSGRVPTPALEANVSASSTPHLVLRGAGVVAGTAVALLSIAGPAAAQLIGVPPPPAPSVYVPPAPALPPVYVPPAPAVAPAYVAPLPPYTPPVNSPPVVSAPVQLPVGGGGSVGFGGGPISGPISGPVSGVVGGVGGAVGTLGGAVSGTVGGAVGTVGGAVGNIGGTVGSLPSTIYGAAGNLTGGYGGVGGSGGGAGLPGAPATGAPAPGGATTAPGGTAGAPGAPAVFGAAVTGPVAKAAGASRDNLLGAASAFLPSTLVTSFADLGSTPGSLKAVPAPDLALLPQSRLQDVQAPLLAAAQRSANGSVLQAIRAQVVRGMLIVLATIAVPLVGAANVRVRQLNPRSRGTGVAGWGAQVGAATAMLHAEPALALGVARDRLADMFPMRTMGERAARLLSTRVRVGAS